MHMNVTNREDSFSPSTIKSGVNLERYTRQDT